MKPPIVAVVSKRNRGIPAAPQLTLGCIGLSLSLGCGGANHASDNDPSHDDDGGGVPLPTAMLDAAKADSADGAPATNCVPTSDAAAGPSACGGVPRDAGQPVDGGVPTLSSTPGWHKIPATSLCGGPENASLSVPDNFPANLSSSYASYGFPFADTCDNEYEDSSTAIVDPLRNRLIFWGGGHNGYWGNDVYELDVDNIGTSKPVLTRLTNPANPNDPVGGTSQEPYELLNACSYAPGCTPTKQSPGSRHSYNNLAYLPSSDQMLSFGGALTPNGYASSATWTLDMSSISPSCAPNCDPLWTRLAATNVIGNQVNLVNYDPNTGGLWMIDVYPEDPGPSIWFFDPSTSAWSQHGTVSLGYHSYSVLDPDDKLFITVGGADGLHAFDASNPAAANIAFQTPATAGCSGLLTGFGGNPQYPGLAWDPIGKVVVGYPNGGNVLYLLDPKTWTCTTATYGATQGTDYPQNTPITLGDMGTFGHFQYIQANDIFVLCNDSHNDCWYLRPKR